MTVDPEKSIQCRALEGGRVGLRLADKASGTMDHKQAVEISRELRLLAMVAVSQVCYRFLFDGRPVYVDLEGPVALRFADALYQCSLISAEHAQAQRIAEDSALLYRSGAPFGLSDREDIRGEAKKIAAWDSALRRAIPGGVKSAEAFGLPSIIQH